jgi:hypothetical protein
MAIMRKSSFLLVFICLLFGGGTAFSQIDERAFLELSVEDQLKIYFDTYRGEQSLGRGAPRVASLIVSTNWTAVIPYLKEYLRDADLFSVRKNWPSGNNPDSYIGETTDNTLELIAIIWMTLRAYSDPVYHNNYPTIYMQYTLDETEIQWFIDEYKRRIDEYILVTRMIDNAVMASEKMIDDIAVSGLGFSSDRRREEFLKYGHPYFGDGYSYRGRLLKEYYEQRLGISGLTIDYDVFIE